MKLKFEPYVLEPFDDYYKFPSKKNSSKFINEIMADYHLFLRDLEHDYRNKLQDLHIDHQHRIADARRKLEQDLK